MNEKLLLKVDPLSWKIKVKKGYPCGKVILASKYINIVAHHIMGKITSKKTLSCTHTKVDLLNGHRLVRSTHLTEKIYKIRSVIFSTRLNSDFFGLDQLARGLTELARG